MKKQIESNQYYLLIIQIIVIMVSNIYDATRTGTRIQAKEKCYSWIYTTSVRINLSASHEQKWTKISKI